MYSHNVNTECSKDVFYKWQYNNYQRESEFFHAKSPIQYVPKMFMHKWQHNFQRELWIFCMAKIQYSMSKRCIAIILIQYVPKMFMYQLQYNMSQRKLKILMLRLLKSSCQQQQEEEVSRSVLRTCYRNYVATQVKN